MAKNNWEGLAIGSALAGTGLTIGENVVGMDPASKFDKGEIKRLSVEFPLRTQSTLRKYGYL